MEGKPSPYVASLTHLVAGLEAEVELATQAPVVLDAVVADDHAARAALPRNLVECKRVLDAEAARTRERVSRKRKHVQELRSVRCPLRTDSFPR